MPSWRSLVACWTLGALVGCGGSSGKSSSSGTGGSAGSTSNSGGSNSSSSGTGGTDNSSEALFEQFLESAGTLCEQIRSCYPDLQTQGAPTCTAPANDDRTVLFQDPPLEELAAFAECYRSYSDQMALASLMQCQLDAFDDQVACFATCPESGEDCALQGNDAHALCTETFPIDSVELNACFQASQ
jgi:hypothetical protein